MRIFSRRIEINFVNLYNFYFMVFLIILWTLNASMISPYLLIHLLNILLDVLHSIHLQKP
jgi:hypothetical protein